MNDLLNFLYKPNLILEFANNVKNMNKIYKSK